MQRKGISKFQTAIIFFIRKYIMGNGLKAVLKKLKKMKEKRGLRWTKKNGNKFRSLSFEQRKEVLEE